MEHDEGNNVQPLEKENLEELEKTNEFVKKRKKRDFYIELALFFILGALAGIAVKVEAEKRISIGYEDYKMKIEKQDYDLNQLQEKLIEEQIEAQRQENAQSDSGSQNLENPENSNN